MFARMPTERAAIWSLLAGYLLLPSGLAVDLHLLPPLDKSSVTVLSTLFCCHAKGGALRRGSVGILLPLLAAAFVLAPVGASFGNSYELKIGSLSIPGFYLMDGLKAAINNLIQISAFWIGLRFLSSATGRIETLKALVAGMLVYSLPILVEVRLSPQIHRWVYGYAPFGFSTQYRWQGYRPVVFFPHGLQLALFVVMALIAACILSRARIRVFRMPASFAAAYLVPIIVLCKTMGAAVYAIFLAPLALICRPSACVKVAMVVMIFVCAYPALRTQQLVPVESIVSAANQVSQDRAASFVTRLTNESLLMAKANEKPVFGWGGWGRNRVYDADYAKDITITDGGWIIYFGLYGWIGYLGLFGMFAMSVANLNASISKFDRRDALVSAGMVLILTANIADMLPNANLTPFTFVIAGAIARKAVTARKSKQVPAAPRIETAHPQLAQSSSRIGHGA